MAISKKPKPQNLEQENVSEQEAAVRAIINKGGSVPRREENDRDEQTNEDDKHRRVQLRLIPECVEMIDELRSQYGFAKPSRHAWILDAIVEKINREKSVN